MLYEVITRGITWGLAHFTNYSGDWKKEYTILGRFDCDLSLDLDDKGLKQTQTKFRPEVYFSNGLTEQQKQRITKQ